MTALTFTNVFHNPIFNLDIWPSKAFAYLDKHLSNKLCTKLQRINVYFEIFCLFRQIAFIYRETFLNILLPHFNMAYAFISEILILGLIVSHKSFGFSLNLQYSWYFDVHDIHGWQRRNNWCNAFSITDTRKFRFLLDMFANQIIILRRKIFNYKQVWTNFPQILIFSWRFQVENLTDGTGEDLLLCDTTCVVVSPLKNVCCADVRGKKLRLTIIWHENETITFQLSVNLGLFIVKLLLWCIQWFHCKFQRFFNNYTHLTIWLIIKNVNVTFETIKSSIDGDKRVLEQENVIKFDRQKMWTALKASNLRNE